MAYLKKIIFGFFIICFVIAQMACSGPSTFDPDPEPAPDESVEALLTQGQQELADLDIVEANETYCDTYYDGTTDAEIAFGCFLTTALLLPESDDVDTIMGMFGEDEIDTEEDIIQGLFHDEYAYGSSLIKYQVMGKTFSTKYKIPFVKTTTPYYYSPSNPIADLFKRMVDSGTTMTELVDQAYELEGELIDLEELLAVVLDDSSFTFSIPQELFNTDDDIQIIYNDVRLMMASVKGTIVALNIVAAYDYGVDVSKVITTDTYGRNHFDYEILTEDLNGSGATVNGETVDTTMFLTLTDASLISDQRTRFIEALDYVIDAMNDMSADRISDYESSDFQKQITYTDLLAFVEDMKTSAESTGFVEVEGFEGIQVKTVMVDLYTFFTNPPSATDVTSYDPFVYNSYRDTVEPVEAFFRDMMSDCLSVN